MNISTFLRVAGIDNKSSNFIPEMVSCLEIKIQGFFCKKISRFDKQHCEVLRYVSIRDLLKTCSTKGIQYYMKTIGRLVLHAYLLKSCVVLMRKLALFVGNLCMICMLRKFLAFNPCKLSLFFMKRLKSTCEKLKHLKEIKTLKHV